MEIAKLQPLDDTSRGPFFAALDTVDSDFEHRRVLTALMKRSDLPRGDVASVLESSRRRSSRTSRWRRCSWTSPSAGRSKAPLRAPFFRALETVGSTFERGRVLQAVGDARGASEETVLAALRSPAGMGSASRPDRCCWSSPRTHPLSPAARDAYIDAAEKLGDFEQGKVLVGAGAERAPQVTQP